MTIRECSTVQVKAPETPFGAIASTHGRFSHPTSSMRQFARGSLAVLKEQSRRRLAQAHGFSLALLPQKLAMVRGHTCCSLARRTLSRLGTCSVCGSQLIPADALRAPPVLDAGRHENIAGSRCSVGADCTLGKSVSSAPLTLAPWQFAKFFKLQNKGEHQHEWTADIPCSWSALLRRNPH